MLSSGFGSQLFHLLIRHGLPKTMYHRMRVASSSFLSKAILAFNRRHSSNSAASCRAIFLGAALGVVGGNLVFADKSDSDRTSNSEKARPRQSSYKYVICGGGVAAKEALNVFVEAQCAEEVLLISPEWNEYCTDTNKADDATGGAGSEPRDEPQTGAFSKAFQALSSSLTRVPPPPPKSAEIIVGRKVAELDPTSRAVTLDDGMQISFEKCLIAVGVSPPPIPIGKVVSQNASHLVGTAWSSTDWHNINGLIRNAFSTNASSPSTESSGRAHITVVGGGWMSAVVGAALVDRGADVTFSYADPSFLSRCLPKYLSRDIYNRLTWLSDGGIDLLSYAALRYVIARRTRTVSESSDVGDSTDMEAEVHVGTVFDAFSIVDFRTDFVVFSPTLPPASPIHVPNVPKRGGAFVPNTELAVATDVYVAGACADVTTNLNDANMGPNTPTLIRWSVDYARATGRHAAHNMLGARKPYMSDISAVTVDLTHVGLKVTVVGNVDGSLESFGYFLKRRGEPEAACGGGFERGVLFCVEAAPLRFRGASIQLNVTGIALWDGVADGSFSRLENAKTNAVELLGSAPMSRSDLEAAMDTFAAEHVGISLYNEMENGVKPGDESVRDSESEKVNKSQDDEEKNCIGEFKGGVANENFEARPELKPLDTARRRNPRVIWRRHQPARIVPLREEELLWVDDVWLGTVSPAKKVDKKSQAFIDLLKKNASGK